MIDQLAKAIASRRALVEDAARGMVAAAATETAGGPAGDPPADEPAEVRDEPADVTDMPADVKVIEPSTVPVPKRPAAKRRTSAGREADPPPRAEAAPPGEPARRGRRRFSLPPLDDDHEKVNRSIETFLGGAESVTPDAPSGAQTIAVGATTVALVAVDGLPLRRRRSRSALTAVDDDATSNALAMVERTIRGAARGTDVVTVVDRGRFRIVLASTGEVAARAYLRRIRATVEPLLESADRPLHLAVATATVLDEPLSAAVRRADHRLTSALATLAAPDAPRMLGAAHPDALPQRGAKPGGAESRTREPGVGEPARGDQPAPQEPRAVAD